MKKIKIPAIVILVLPLFFSCKNNSYTVPSFFATGYWIGHLSIGSNIRIIIRQDGTSRLYLSTNLDTTTVLHKYDGTYTVNKDIFRFQPYPDRDGTDFYMETTRTSPGSMSGVLVIRSSSEN